MRALAEFDRTHSAGRLFGGWKNAQHPQLGEVELGGFDPRVGIWNPPYERLPETCATQSAALLRVAALVPRISLTVVSHTKTADHTRIELRVANQGSLGSIGMPLTKGVSYAEPLRLTAGGEGLTLLDPTKSVAQIGHLAGWGGGLYGGPSVFSPWNGHPRRVTHARPCWGLRPRSARGLIAPVMRLAHRSSDAGSQP